METVDGILSRVMYHAPSKWNPAGTPFLIARLTNGRTVKGEMRRPVEGEQYRFWGEWKPQRGRDEPAFEFTSYEAIVDRSASGAEQYLAAHVEGVGRVKAAALAEHFGADTLDILRAEPDRATEVHGIHARIVDAIRDHFAEAKIDPRAFARLVDLFNSGGHKVSKAAVKAMLQDFGSGAPDAILENPYRLLAYRGIGWKTADAFAMVTAKYDPNGIERHKAAVLEAIDRVTDQGHTFATRGDVTFGVNQLIQSLPRMDAIAALIANRDIVGDGERWAPADLWDAEAEIARRLASLAAAARPLPAGFDVAGLADDQAVAVDVIREHGVCLLIGPPGCGKSYAIARVIAALRSLGVGPIRVVAPTGKASKRAAELLAGAGIDPEAVPATTIHKALGPVPAAGPEGVPQTDAAKVGRGREGFEFGANEASPVEASVLIVDETSMVDVRLMAALLRATAAGTRVVFVGDENQLPSVGPGSVLRDMIDGGLPVAQLTKIKRSDGGGRVVKACHAIKDGREPQPAVALMPPTENWIHIEESNPERIAGLIIELHSLASQYDPFWGFQVVSAQKAKHAFACENLNRLLSLELNPPDPKASPAETSQAQPFRIGDKVIRTKNGVVDALIACEADWDGDWHWNGGDYRIDETPVVNGDMGTVLDVVVEPRQSWVIVRFRDPERLCRIPFGEHNLIQAYAVTVHKAQGSGFPVVIVPCHTSFYWDARTGQGLWNRELFYTAISRAEQILVTVGQWAAVRAAVGRRTVHRRHTRLVELIRLAREGEAFEAAAAVVPFAPAVAAIPEEYDVEVEAEPCAIPF